MKVKTPEQLFKERRDGINRNYEAKLAARPLRFGDAQQIKALNDWERELRLIDEEEHTRSDPNAPLITWRVSYSYRTENDECFEARTAEEAKEMARDEYAHEDDFEIDCCEAVPTKKRA